MTARNGITRSVVKAKLLPAMKKTLFPRPADPAYDRFKRANERTRRQDLVKRLWDTEQALNAVSEKYERTIESRIEQIENYIGGSLRN